MLKNLGRVYIYQAEIDCLELYQCYLTRICRSDGDEGLNVGKLAARLATIQTSTQPYFFYRNHTVMFAPIGTDEKGYKAGDGAMAK